MCGLKQKHWSAVHRCPTELSEGLASLEGVGPEWQGCELRESRSQRDRREGVVDTAHIRQPCHQVGQQRGPACHETAEHSRPLDTVYLRTYGRL